MLYFLHSIHFSLGQISWLKFCALFGSGSTRGKAREVWAFPNTMAPLAQAWLLLVGSTLLGGRVIQAHVLLARSSAHHPQVLGHMVISKQPLLSDLCVFTRLREVLSKRKEKQVLWLSKADHLP